MGGLLKGSGEQFMYAVIFEVKPKTEGKNEYLKIAAELRRFLEDRDGFISIERFQSLSEEGKILSLSFWQDEAAIEKWRNLLEHRAAQKKGKESLFHSYRIRVAQIVRDYTESNRSEARQIQMMLLSNRELETDGKSRTAIIMDHLPISCRYSGKIGR